MKITAFVYSDPSVSVLIFATFSGILMSAGMGFLLEVFRGDETQRLGVRQLAGLLLFLAAILSSWAAWIGPRFRAEMEGRPPESSAQPADGESWEYRPMGERRQDFEHWPGRRKATLAVFLSSVLFAGAVALLLALAIKGGPDPPASPQSPDPRATPICYTTQTHR